MAEYRAGARLAVPQIPVGGIIGVSSPVTGITCSRFRWRLPNAILKFWMS